MGFKNKLSIAVAMGRAVKEKLTEDTFTELLPEAVRMKSARFFTPAHIAIKSAKWLSGADKRKILDVGAGAGKFCLFGACNTQSQFYGIESRPNLVNIARSILEIFEVKNVEIIEGNIVDFNFSDFKAFYLYNPFYENLVPYLRMDNNLLLSVHLYDKYTQYTKQQLSMASKGTRLVTYFGTTFDLPESYKLIREFENGLLKYWLKKN